MKQGILILLCIAAILMPSCAVWAIDEAILTPTNNKVKPAEEKAFNNAMGVWFSHRYSDGEKLLKEFSKKYPNSRWAAEADLHVGCYLTFCGNYSEAKQIFNRLAADNKNTNIREKATVRLGNIAEREGRWDDAIRYYSNILKMNPTWGQFKYANYNARTLSMKRHALQAKLNCGPVALAACLEALGKKAEAQTAKTYKVTADGVSLFALAEQAAKLGVNAQTVNLPFTEIKKADLPVLAHIQPNHYIALLSINNDTAHVEDSIKGKYDMPLAELEPKWSGKAIAFKSASNLAVLSMAEASSVSGGCCGNTDEPECTGCPSDCQHASSGSSSSGGSGSGAGVMPTIGGKDCKSCNAGSGGGNNGGSECCDVSGGRPSWKVNTVNLNILVTDTPIWYNPGKGYNIAFTLNYSNENSNTGIFGRGWHSVYDMKVFFLPGYDTQHPDLQVHRDTGRVETYQYQYDGSIYKYIPRTGYEAYGYRDEIEILNSTDAAAESVAEGSIRIKRRGGGKYFFKPQGSGLTIEGRIYIIEDQIGNRVTCGYANDVLETVTDANGGVTNIGTQGTGINERVTYVSIPKFENGNWVADDREASFGYTTEGDLIAITDMLGDTSTLSYNALLPETIGQYSASTLLDGNITDSSPANGGNLVVDSTDGFLPSGKVKVNNNEEIAYTSTTPTAFRGITRGNPALSANDNSSVEQVVPTTDLSSDITSTSPATGASLNVVSTDGFPNSGWIAVDGVNGEEYINYTGKTSTSPLLFTGITRGDPAYAAVASTTDIWLCQQTPYLSEIATPSMKTQFRYAWIGNTATGDFIGLHEIRECGANETSYPTTPTIHYYWERYSGYFADETRYGDRMRRYYFYGIGDALGSIVDELSNTTASYGYSGNRDRTSITDASGHTTGYYYGTDGEHNMYKRTDPLGNEWAYTYYEDHSLHTETDAYDRLVRTYSYNSAGQITEIDGPNSVCDSPPCKLAENHYDSAGRLDWSKDARGMQTNYHYGEDSESRGFLTSVHDPENKATLYHYDEKGRRDTVTDPNSTVTQYVYDDLDRVIKVIHGSGANDPSTETKYTCCHKVYDQDENGRRTYYLYDIKNRLSKVVTSAKSTTLATVITPNDPADSGYLSVASVADLPTSGNVVVLDEIISYTGKDTQYNRLTGITRGASDTRREVASGFPVGLVGTVQATYGYHADYLDWMISLTDAENHTTYYTYYANGKLKTIRYPDDKGERYTYDNSNSGNNMTVKEYGTVSGTYPGTFAPNNDLTVNYTYDANNRLIRVCEGP